MMRFLIIYILSSLSVYASGENHFKLKAELKDKLDIIKSGTNGPVHIFTQDTDQEIYQKIFNLLPSEKINSIYSLITKKIKPIYKNKSDQLIKRTLQSQDFDFGTISSNGFSWQKPLGVVDINVERVITQSFDGRWKVYDIHKFEIEAKTFLDKLIKLNMLEVSEVAMSALAEVKFMRKFVYEHSHNTYEQALNSDTENLFLPFQLTQNFQLLKGEKVTLSDAFTSNIESSAQAQVTPYLEAGISSSFKIDLLRESRLKRREDNFFDLRKTRSQNYNLGVNFDIKLKFFNLLKLSLLNFGYYGIIQKNTQEAYKVHPIITSKKTIHQFFNFLPVSRQERKELLKSRKFLRKTSNKSNGFAFDSFGLKKSQDKSKGFIKYESSKKNYAFETHHQHFSQKKKSFKGYFQSKLLESILGISLDFNLLSSTDIRMKSQHLILQKESAFHHINIRDFIRVKKRSDLTEVSELIHNKTSLAKSLELNTLLPLLNEGVINDLNIYVSKDFLRERKSLNNHFIEICSKHKKFNTCFRRLNKTYNRLMNSITNVSVDLKGFHRFIAKLIKYGADLKSIEKIFGSDKVSISGRLSMNVSNRSKFFDYHTGSMSPGDNLDSFEDFFFE